jgi:hypothetical protein
LSVFLGPENVIVTIVKLSVAECLVKPLDVSERRTRHANDEKRNHGLFYVSIQDQIHSRIGNSFVLWHSDGLIETESGPQQEQRSQIPGAFLERIIHDLNEYVQGCVAELERAQNDESYRPRRDVWSDDIS